MSGRGWMGVDRYIVDDNGCWIWQGAKTHGGYGVVGVPGCRKNAVAHRVMYEREVGPIPGGLDLDHLCRVRHCINPDHLEPVTRRVNIERGIMAKITEADAQEIRRLYAEEMLVPNARGKKRRQVRNGFAKALAEKYGVHSGHISSIAGGSVWAER